VTSAKTLACASGSGEHEIMNAALDSPDPHLRSQSLAFSRHVFDVEHEVGSPVFFVPDRVGAVVRSR